MNYGDAGTVPSTWKIGDVILDRYEVSQIFTSGGMGLVYRAHHRDWNMDLAVKAPRPEYFQSETQIENFEKEAETWVNLGLHPNIVSCYYVRRLGGIPRIFAEYVEGGTLADWIRTKRLYEGNRKALERIIDIAIQFAWGLQYSHEKGLVHQDVKPGNVLMTSDGVAKVCDFGLANARRASGEDTSVATQPGQSILVPGAGFMTPAYASPEQIRGEPLSRKTDIWSWAVSLLELLIGDLTWTSGVAAPAVIDELDDGQCDAELIALLEGCFGSNARERFASFEPIVATLIAYYTSQFGTYPRSEPQPSQVSSDEANNRAVTLADLGKDEGALLAFEAVLSSDPTHPITVYNYALLNWRLGYKSDEFGRDALDALLQRDDADPLALVVNALFCAERGIFHKAHRLYRRIRSESDLATPYQAELEALLTDARESDLRPPRILPLCVREVRSLRVSPNGTCLVVTDKSGCLTSFNTETGDRYIVLSTEYRFLTWTGNDALLLHANRVVSWNLHETPELLPQFRMEVPENDDIAVSPSGFRCLIARGDVLTMFDTNTGEVLWEHELQEMSMEVEVGWSQDYRIRNLAFSPSGQYVAVATSRDLISMEVFDTDEGCQVDYQDHRGKVLHFAADFILTTDSSDSAQSLVTWAFAKSHAAKRFSSRREESRYHVTVKGVHALDWRSQLGLPSTAGTKMAVLTRDNCIQILRVPELTRVVTIQWNELLDDRQVNGHPVCVACDAESCFVATSEGEIVTFRITEPGRAPLLISKPSSIESLALRWKSQASLLHQAKAAFDAENLASALDVSRRAAMIRGGRDIEAAQLYDRVAAVGRKQSIREIRLKFDLRRTIMGPNFQLLDVSNDGRCALVKRTRFRQGEEYRAYTDDHYRIIHLLNGSAESIPQLAVEYDLLRKIGRNGNTIIASTKTGLTVASIGGGNPFQLIPPPMWNFKTDKGEQNPRYYASDVQYALGGEAIVASDLAPEWCFDKGRCEEWHVYLPQGGEAVRIHTDTRYLRIMPDGFHGYAISPRGIYWMEWPFRSALETFGFPMDAGRSEVTRDAIAISSDGARIFYGDRNGGLHVWKVEQDRRGDWKKVDAHSGEIIRVCTGTDPRFVATAGADGLKIWDATDMTLLLHRERIVPSWISDDFRFVAEKAGCIWEIEWDYSFDMPDEFERLAAPHIKAFLETRRALAELSEATWNEKLEASDSALYDFLRSHSASERLIDQIKDAGPKGYTGWGKIKERLGTTPDKLKVDRLLSAAIDVREQQQKEVAWKPSASEALLRHLAKCGCGRLTTEHIISITKARFPYLLKQLTGISE